MTTTATHHPLCRDHCDVTGTCSTGMAVAPGAVMWADSYPSGTELHLGMPDPDRAYSPAEWRELILAMGAVLADAEGA